MTARMRGWNPEGTRAPGALGIFIALAARCRDADLNATNEDMILMLCRLNEKHRLGLGSDTDVRHAIESHLEHVAVDFYLAA